VRIEPRVAWGAIPPNAPYLPWAPGGPTGLVVHWVGGAGSLGIQTHGDCPSRIRAIQRYEMNTGYSDIAYSLVCCPHGSVYAGRGLEMRSAANGPSANGTMPSVCLLLNEADAMTPAMEDAIRTLRREHTPGPLRGHREVNTTACPGVRVQAWIEAERRTPPAPPTPPMMEENDMMLVRADGDPRVYVTNGPWKAHVTAEAYPQWIFTLTGRPGALDPKTGREWVLPKAMVGTPRDVASA
jgi:hypothetical protein